MIAFVGMGYFSVLTKALIDGILTIIIRNESNGNFERILRFFLVEVDRKIHRQIRKYGKDCANKAD